jgi:hypothetical protein
MKMGLRPPGAAGGWARVDRMNDRRGFLLYDPPHRAMVV